MFEAVDGRQRVGVSDLLREAGDAERAELGGEMKVPKFKATSLMRWVKSAPASARALIFPQAAALRRRASSCRTAGCSARSAANSVQ
jgi:hypothetical protein